MDREHNSRDRLEKELAAFRPRAVSPSLRDGIAARIESEGPSGSSPRVFPRTIRGWAAVLLATGACLLVAVSIHVASRVPVDFRGTEPGVGRVEQIDEFDAPQPTVLAYTLALGNSESNLDDLLDAHASALLPPTANHFSVWSGENVVPN